MDRKERELQAAKLLERAAYALVGAVFIIFAIILTVSLCSRNGASRASVDVSDNPPNSFVEQTPKSKPIVSKDSKPSPDDEYDDYYSFDEEPDPDEYDDFAETYEEYEEDYSEYEVDDFYDENDVSDDDVDEDFGEYPDEYVDEEEDGVSPTVIVPKDFKTLAEALDFVGGKGSILLLKSSKPYSLGQSRFLEDRSGCVVQSSITIQGETDDPSDVTIVINQDQSLFVENLEDTPVILKNLTVRSEVRRKSSGEFYPSVLVAKGDVEIRNCVFLGERSTNLIGVSTFGASSSAKLVDSTFSAYGGCGVMVGESSEATVIRCQFDKRSRCGLYVNNDGKVNVSACVFRQNNLAVYGGFGISGFFNDCEFIKNRENWKFEDNWQDLKVSRLRNKE
ncbi:MAG: right-handed parallel beta-helix repeat-containing protein [Thermoguttaceae bacterium]|nr:right-handed parallel beta-helix repeat-containing protein [Thermoguttaceae bacterium]